jgi:hypothetical protein
MLWSWSGVRTTTHVSWNIHRYDPLRRRSRARVPTSRRDPGEHALGCYFCFHAFPNTDIKAWVDSNQTALCPACGIDAVIGDASKHRLDGKFLRQMHTYFFSSSSKKR